MERVDKEVGEEAFNKGRFSEAIGTLPQDVDLELLRNLPHLPAYRKIV